MNVEWQFLSGKPVIDIGSLATDEAEDIGDEGVLNGLVGDLSSQCGLGGGDELVVMVLVDLGNGLGGLLEDLLDLFLSLRLLRNVLNNFLSEFLGSVEDIVNLDLLSLSLNFLLLFLDLLVDIGNGGETSLDLADDRLDLLDSVLNGSISVNRDLFVLKDIGRGAENGNGAGLNLLSDLGGKVTKNVGLSKSSIGLERDSAHVGGEKAGSKSFHMNRAFFDFIQSVVVNLNLFDLTVAIIKTIISSKLFS